INHILLVINNCLLYQRVVDLSTIDELTKLFNRRKIMEILKTELERAQRYNFDLSIIMADIDYFKKINDNYGHKMGDIVLKKVATILKNSLRKVDYVGRFGGEEFLIISPQTTSENARILAERVKNIFNTLKIEGLEEKVTLSFGISSFRNKLTIDEFIQEADLALYESKNKGRNTITVFGGSK
ncbi:MAG: GGDEF domain-containing protein, partial [Proteobacteria bacterium]|nr:GGDEF domain-containing protein [Pseudomonadota bacterium]